MSHVLVLEIYVHDKLNLNTKGKWFSRELRRAPRRRKRMNRSSFVNVHDGHNRKSLQLSSSYEYKRRSSVLCESAVRHSERP